MRTSSPQLETMLTGSNPQLEGWLQKKKSGGGTAVFSANNRRWFNTREVKGSSDQSELALCYYKSQREKEAKGWIYLRDVVEITDDEKSLTIISTARSMTLEAPSSGEHRLWLQGLVQLCPQAITACIKSERRTPISKSKCDKDGRIANLTSQSILQNTTAQNITRPATPALSGPRARDTTTAAEAKVLRCLSVPSKEDKARENILPPDDADAATTNSANSRGSGGSSGVTSGNRPRPERKDHRKSAFRSGLSPMAGATQRLHGHIRMEADTAAQAKASSPPRGDDIGVSSKQEKADADGEHDSDDGRRLLAAPFPRPMADPSLDDLETMGSVDPAAAARHAAHRRRERRGQVGSSARAGRDVASDTDDEVDAEQSRPVVSRRDLGKDAEKEAIMQGHVAAESKTGGEVDESIAAPRRARDLLAPDPAGQGGSTQRPSIDDLLARRDSKRSADDDMSESDRNEALLDLQLAKLRYSLLMQPEEEAHQQKQEGEDTQSKSEGFPAPSTAPRPPRPPAGAINPYLSKAPSAAVSSFASMSANAGNALSSHTPPRQPGDPGVPVDANFATENWDNDSSGYIDSPPVRKIVRASDKRGRGSHGSDDARRITPDANWLEDDFDKDT